MTVWTTSQGVYAARTVIAELLSMEYHRVRVIKVPMGGSFGGKTEYIIEPVCAFLGARHPPARQAPPGPRGVHGRDDGPPCHLDDDPHRLHAGWHAARLRGRLDAGRRRLRLEHADYSIHMCKKVTKLYRTPHYQHQEPRRAHEHSGRGRRPRLGRP